MRPWGRLIHRTCWIDTDLRSEVLQHIDELIFSPTLSRYTTDYSLCVLLSELSVQFAHTFLNWVILDSLGLSGWVISAVKCSALTIRAHTYPTICTCFWNTVCFSEFLHGSTVQKLESGWYAIPVRKKPTPVTVLSSVYVNAVCLNERECLPPLPESLLCQAL